MREVVGFCSDLPIDVVFGKLGVVVFVFELSEIAMFSLESVFRADFVEVLVLTIMWNMNRPAPKRAATEENVMVKINDFLLIFKSLCLLLDSVVSRIIRSSLAQLSQEDK